MSTPTHGFDHLSSFYGLELELGDHVITPEGLATVVGADNHVLVEYDDGRPRGRWHPHDVDVVEIVRAKKPRASDGALYHAVQAKVPPRDDHGRELARCEATVRSQWRRIDYEPSDRMCPECFPQLESGVCRECGCTYDSPCMDPGPCAWADEERTLCTSCQEEGG